MSQYVDSSTILVAEFMSNGHWNVSLFAYDTGALISMAEMTNSEIPLPLKLGDANLITDWLMSGFEEYVIAAIVIIDSFSDNKSPNAPQCLRENQVHVYIIPSWLAIGNAVHLKSQHFSLIDTINPGRCCLIFRQGDGIIHRLDRSNLTLRSLLELDPKSSIKTNDVLEEAVLVHPNLTYTRPTDLLPHKALESLAMTNRDGLVAVLSDSLSPLIRTFASAANFVDCSHIVCTGNFFSSQKLGEIFRETFTEAIRKFHPEMEINISIVTSTMERHYGAWQYVKEAINLPGVFLARAKNAFQFHLRSAADVSYRVLHPPRYVFDQADTTLASVINNSPVLAVVDKKVNQIYGKDIRDYLRNKVGTAEIVVIEGLESRKSWDQAQAVCQKAIDADLRRDGIIVGIGGGVTLDIAGFAASIYRRGVSYIRIPTTLVGLIDVGVGVKQGINFAGKKNILGSFYPAKGNINDTGFLKTLDTKEVACGIAEIIKMGVIREPKIFELVEQHATTLLESKFQEPRNIAVEIVRIAESSMLKELQSNLFEGELRRSVDFGHSFSPTIESMSDYEISHGQAVAIDMLLCTYIAVQRGLCDRSILLRMVNLYSNLTLPYSQNFCDVNVLYQALESVRAHRGGQLNLVIPVRIGEAEFLQEINYAELSDALVYTQALSDRGDGK